MSDPRDDLAALEVILGEAGYYPEDQAAAVIAAGWRPPVPHCDHEWSTDRSTYGGNPWRECNLCGKQEDL